MYFLTIFTLVLASIGACVADPIPAAHKAAMTAALSDRELEARAFWPCVRCTLECSAVAVGCGMVCMIPELDVALCGLCIAGAGGSKACIECWPRCHGKDMYKFKKLEPLPAGMRIEGGTPPSKPPTPFKGPITR